MWPVGVRVVQRTLAAARQRGPLRTSADDPGHEASYLAFRDMTGAASKSRAASASPRSAGALVAPRLLDLRQAAIYLGCSYWTVRDYVLASVIPVVELPALRSREGEPPRKRLRRVLIDRSDLDAFIDARKVGG